MSDIEDQVIRAIQSYAQMLPGDGDDKIVMMMLANDMAPYIIKSLGLRQEFGLIRLWHDEIDLVTHTGDNPVWAAAEVQLQEEFCPTSSDDPNRCYLGSRLYTEWIEEKGTPLDPDLVQLAAEADGQQ